MKKFLLALLDLWNIYAGVILSVLIIWFCNFNRDSITLVTSIILLVLTTVSSLTYIKSYAKAQRKKKIKHAKKEKPIISAVERAVLRQPTISAITNSLLIEENAIENGDTIIQIAKNLERAGKKSMMWIKKNVGAIVEVLLALIATLGIILDSAIQCFASALPVIFGSSTVITIISIVLYAMGAIVGALTSGFGSAKFKEKLAELKDQLNGDETDLTYINDKKFLERQIKVYTVAVEGVKKEITSLSNSYVEVINEFDSCQRLNLVVDEDTLAKYTEYTDKNKSLQTKLSNKQTALDTYQKKLAELEAANAKTTA